MPTNLALDDALIKEAVKLGKHKTKKAAVTAALEEYVRESQRLMTAGKARGADEGASSKMRRAKS